MLLYRNLDSWIPQQLNNSVELHPRLPFLSRIIDLSHRTHSHNLINNNGVKIIGMLFK